MILVVAYVCILFVVYYLTLFGWDGNKSFANDENITPALVLPLPAPPIPSMAGLVTPL